MKRVPLAFVIVVAIAVGCSESNPQISDADYDRTCSSDSDCVPVWKGDVCSCQNLGAINQSALESFEREKNSLQENCSSIPSCRAPDERWRAVCNVGTCIVQSRSEDAGSDSESDSETAD